MAVLVPIFGSQGNAGGLTITIGLTGQLNDLADVIIDNPLNGQTLTYNGYVWTNQDNAAPTSADISGLQTQIDSISANQIGLDLRVTSLEYSVGSLAEVSGSFATNSNVQAMSAGLDSRITIVELTNSSQQSTLSQLASVTGSIPMSQLDARFVNVTGDTMRGTLALSGAAIDYDTSYIPPWKEGRVFYDIVQHTLSYYNDNQEVTVNIGQEQLVRVRNSTASTIINGKVVCISGATGSHPNIILASKSSLNADFTLGMATHNINVNEDGYVTVNGLVNGLDTSMFSAEGAILWLDNDGNVTETKPSAPHSKVRIGYVVRKHNTQGSILISINLGSHVNDLSDVSTSGVTSGSILVWDGLVWNSNNNIKDYALNVNVQAMSAGLNSRVSTVELINSAQQTTLSQLTSITGNNNINSASLSAYALNSNVQAMSAGLDTRILTNVNSISEQQNVLSTLTSLSGNLESGNPLYEVDAYNQGGIEYYNGSTSTWGTLTVTISGATSLATATVRTASGTTAGFLSLTAIVGNFIEGESITSSNGKTVTVKKFKKKLIGIQRIPVNNNNGMIAYGLPYGMSNAISGTGGSAASTDQLFWMGDNENVMFVSPSFNSDIVIQKDYAGSTVAANQIAIGWEGVYMQLKVAGIIMISSLNGNNLTFPKPALFTNTTQSTDKFSGAGVYSGGVGISGSLFASNATLDTVTVMDLTGNDNNFVSHNVNGKLIDSGVSISSFATNSTIQNVSAGLDSRLTVAETVINSQQITLSELTAITGSVAGVSQSLSGYVNTADTQQVVRGVKVFDRAMCSSTKMLTLPGISGDYDNKTVTLEAADAVLFTTNDGTGQVNIYSIPQMTISLPASADGSLAMIYADYNNGSPEYKAMPSDQAGIINCSNNLPLYRTTLWGGSVITESVYRTFIWDDITYVKPIMSMITPDFGKQGITDQGVYIGNKVANSAGGDASNVMIGSNTANNVVGGIRNVVIGCNAANSLTTGTSISLYGTGSDVRSGNVLHATAIGFMTNVDSYSTVVGAGSYAQSTRAFGEHACAFGHEAQTNNDYSLAIGATSLSEAQNACVIGAYAYNNETNTIQFGSATAPFTKFKVFDGSTTRDLLSTAYLVDAHQTSISSLAQISGNISAYALNSNVQAMSAGLNSRLNVVESTNDAQQTTLSQLTTITGAFTGVSQSLSGYALNSNVQAMSAGLNSAINTLSLSLSGYALNVNVQAMSAGLNSRVSTVELINSAQQTTLSQLTTITGSQVSSINNKANDSVVVHITGNETIAGVKTFSDNVVINGNLTINGSQNIVNTTTVSASDNQININVGEVGAGVTAGYAGIRVDRGSLPSYDFQFREIDDAFVIGQQDSYQAVATREDIPLHGSITYWDSNTNKLVTSSTMTSGNYIPKNEVSDISAGIDSRLQIVEVLAHADNEPNGFENRTDSTIMWNHSINAFTISGNFNIWVNAEKYAKSSEMIFVTPTIGTQFIKYNINGVLTTSTTGWDLFTEVPVATVFYKNDYAESYCAEERHGIVMDAATHKYLHYTIGAKYKSGFDVSNYAVSTNSTTANTYSVSSGVFYDEDLEINVPALSGGPYTVFYRTGANGDWTWGQYTYPYISVSNISKYNVYSGSTWTIANPGLNSYINYYVFATNSLDPRYSIIIIAGQTYNTALADAQAETFTDLSFGNLPFLEMVPVAKITYQYGVSYVSSRFMMVEYTSLLKQSLNIPTVHNALSGLQGGTTSQYYHLTSSQYSDIIGRTEVASISAGLTSAMSGSILNAFNTYVTVSTDLVTIPRSASMVTIEQTTTPITSNLWSSPLVGDTINIRNSTTDGSNFLNGNGYNIEGSSIFEIFNGESFSLKFNGTQWLAF